MKNLLDKNHWLLSRPICHRGLLDENSIENSLSAYEVAVKKGYPLEIDVYSSSDGILYSFHDANLYRMTKFNGEIFNQDSATLETLKLNESEQKIPTLKEVLSLIDGKVPLLIEIKNQPDKKIVQRLVKELKGYNGDIAVQTFNPLYLKKLKKLAPNILRGLLTTKVEEYLKDEKTINKLIVKHTPLNFLCKPQFLSVSYQDLPLKKRKVPIIAWTITDKETEDKISNLCDNILFENFLA